MYVFLYADVSDFVCEAFFGAFSACRTIVPAYHRTWTGFNHAFILEALFALPLFSLIRCAECKKLK